MGFGKPKNSWIKTSSLRITKTCLLKFSGGDGVGGWDGFGEEVNLCSAFDLTSLVPQ